MLIDLLDPYEPKNKTVRAFGGSAATYREVGLNSALWMSTQAVSSITIAGGNGSFISGSRFSLYGIKARS
jgi:hypothetical protein